jgi:hypothetical protein
VLTINGVKKFTILVNNGEYGKGLYNSKEDALIGIKERLPKDFPSIAKEEYSSLIDADFEEFLEGFDYYSVLEIHV